MIFVLYLLLSGLCEGSVPETEVFFNTTLNLGRLPGGHYVTKIRVTSGPLASLFRISRIFLYLAQPHAFPEDLVRSVIEKFRFDSEEYKKIIFYEMGFIVLIVLGILFAVSMPFVGFTLFMCRCFNRCGGELHQSQHKNDFYQRRFLALSLLVISIVMSVCTVFAFLGNQHLTSDIRESRGLFNDNMKDMKTLLTDIPMQINYIASQYDIPKNKTVFEFENIGLLLGTPIKIEFGKHISPALDGVISMAQTIKETKDLLENVTTSTEILIEATKKLTTNLTIARDNLSNTLSDVGCLAPLILPTCRAFNESLKKLLVNINFTRLTPLTSQLSDVKKVLKINLTQMALKGYALYNDVPSLVEKQCQSFLKEVRKTLETTGKDFTLKIKNLPIQRSLKDALNLVNKAEKYVKKYLPLVEQSDVYRWQFSMLSFGMVFLILVFYWLGLLFGVLGFDKRTTPTTRGFISNTGGYLLMVGVACSFLFSSLLMTLVTVTFSVGGNIEKLICEPFKDNTLFQVLDTPYLLNPEWKNYIPGFLFQRPDVNLTFEKVYRECKANKGIFTSLQLDDFFNISQILTVEKYTNDLLQRFERVTISIDNRIFLDEREKDNLLDFITIGLDEIDFDSYWIEAEKSVTKMDLLSFSRELESKKGVVPEGALLYALKWHAHNFQTIYYQNVMPMKTKMIGLNYSVRSLQNLTTGLKLRVTELIDSVTTTQDFINTNTSSIVLKESKKYITDIINNFEQYIAWVRKAVFADVATCKPFSNIIDTIVIFFLCDCITDSMNAFWFGLGSTTVLLIPALVCSFLLSKYYRRMKTEDVYVEEEDNGNGNNGYHKDHLYGLHNPVMTRPLHNSGEAYGHLLEKEF